MKPASHKQLSALHAILHKRGLLEHKAEMVEAFSNGRTSSSKELTIEECRELLSSLYDSKENRNKDDKGQMIRKLFAMCHEIGWVPKNPIIDESGELSEKNDYSRVYAWVLKYGYLKKDLRRYTYKELPKLISAFQEGVYKPFFQKK